MSGRISPVALASRRRWIYAGGLAGLALLRTQPVAPGIRALLTGLTLGTMVLTYASERWLAAGRRVARPSLFVVGVGGIVAGIWLVFRGTLPGLLFAGGGFVFLDRSMTGDGERV